MIDIIKKLLNFKLTVAGIIFGIFSIILMILRFCHQKKGSCSKWFETLLATLDWIVGAILIIRVIGYTIELAKG